MERHGKEFAVYFLFVLADGHFLFGGDGAAKTLYRCRRSDSCGNDGVDECGFAGPVATVQTKALAFPEAKVDAGKQWLVVITEAEVAGFDEQTRRAASGAAGGELNVFGFVLLVGGAELGVEVFDVFAVDPE